MPGTWWAFSNSSRTTTTSGTFRSAFVNFPLHAPSYPLSAPRRLLSASGLEYDSMASHKSLPLLSSDARSRSPWISNAKCVASSLLPTPEGPTSANTRGLPSGMAENSSTRLDSAFCAAFTAVLCPRNEQLSPAHPLPQQPQHPPDIHSESITYIRYDVIRC